MLVLSTLHRLLSQVLSHPHLHTAVLFTPAGELVSVASSSERPKDDIRVLVGLSGEIWRETKENGYGMAESEVIVPIFGHWDTLLMRGVELQLGRITVVPVEDDAEDHALPQHVYAPDVQPLLLIALNGTENVEWSELRSKVCQNNYFRHFPLIPMIGAWNQSKVLSGQLAKPLGKYARILGEPATYSSSQA